MPSRRKFLAGVSTVSTAGVVGCLNTFDTMEGFVYKKAINVEVPRGDGRFTATNVLNVLIERHENTLYGSYDPKYTKSALDEQVITVSDSLHEALRDQFQNIRYLVNVDSTDADTTPVNAAATQTGFNKLTIGGRATVSTRWAEDGDSYVRVHNTEPRQQAISDSNIRTFDLDATFNSD